jgi:hypothetical protein
MESGYTRKKPKSQYARQLAKNKAVDGQVDGNGQVTLKRKRGKSVSTIARELEAKRNAMGRRGQKFAVEHMDDAINWLRGAMSLKQPWLPDGAPRKGGDPELFFRLLGLLRDFTIARAPYQTPRLSAVAIVPQKASSERPTTMTVNIFNQRGERVGDDAKVLTMHAIEDQRQEDEDAA